MIDVHHLVELLQSLDAAGRRGRCGRPVQLAGGQAVQGVVDQGRFAGTGYAGDAGQQADRKAGLDLFQVVAAGALEHQHPLRVEGPALLRHLDALPPREILPGQRVGIGHDRRGRALRDHLPAMHTGAGADVDHMVRQFDGVLVVLDNDHRIAEVAQMQQGIEQPLVVALVQADGGFVQHIHHAHQSGADLAGQTDALRLAARQGVGAAVERQVIQANVDQKAQALADFLDDLCRYLAALTGQVQLLEKTHGAADGQGGEMGQGVAVDEHVPRRPVQAGALAVGAGLVGLIFGQFLAHRHRIGLAVTALHVGNDALEAVTLHHRCSTRRDGLEGNRLAAAAVEDDVLGFIRQVVERLFGIEAVMFGQGQDHLEVVGVAPIPTADRALGQTQMRAVHHQPGIEILLHPEAVASRAGALGIVEGENPRFQFAQRIAAMRTGVFVGKHPGRGGIVHGNDQRNPLGQFQRGFEGFGQAHGQVRPHLEAVDHRLDGVLLAQFQLGRVVQLADLAVDAGANETAVAQVVQHLQVLALALVDHRRQQHPAAVLGLRHDLVDHLADGLRLQRDAVFRAARRADPGIEQPQVVVDFGDGADGRPRIVRGRFLFDGNGRRQAFDVIHIRLFHHRQELPGIGRQRLHVAALALGVNGVEGQRRLAGAGQAGDHDQSVTRQVEVDVLEVMGAGAAYADEVHEGLLG